MANYGVHEVNTKSVPAWVDAGSSDRLMRLSVSTSNGHLDRGASGSPSGPSGAVAAIRTPSYSVIDMRKNPSTPLSVPITKRPASQTTSSKRGHACSVRTLCSLLACFLLITYCTVTVRRLWVRVGILLQHPVVTTPPAPPLLDAAPLLRALDEVYTADAAAAAAAVQALSAPLRSPLPPPITPVNKAHAVQVHDAAAAAVQQQQRRPRRVFLFTMDSISAYVSAAGSGGPAGEITVRESLTAALAGMGVEVVICTSDAQLEAHTAAGGMNDFNAFIFDQWTAFGPGWLPRAFLRGREASTFILAFFGLQGLGHGWEVPGKNILTPFPTVDSNTFLGYAMHPQWVPAGVAAPEGARNLPAKKKRQGVIWGKKPEYFAGKENVLRAVAAVVPLHTTTVALGHIPGIVTHGHLSKQEWSMLLAESRFLIGLGDPLSGPSAMDAVAAGTAFINPVYDAPKERYFMSQHPYLQHHVGPPYVCDVHIDNVVEVLACVNKILDGPDLQPLIPRDFTPDEYAKRVESIFLPVLDAPR